MTSAPSLQSIASWILVAGVIASGVFIFALEGARRPFVAQLSGPICGALLTIGLLALVVGKIP